MVSDKTTRELADDTGVSNNHLRNTVMPSMRKNGAVFEVGTKGQSNEIVWSLNPPGDAASSSRIRRDDADDAALSAVIEDDSQLGNLVGDIEPATVIALDLETMPPAGWKEEVLAEYRTNFAK